MRVLSHSFPQASKIKTVYDRGQSPLAKISMQNGNPSLEQPNYTTSNKHQKYRVCCTGIRAVLGRSELFEILNGFCGVGVELLRGGSGIEMAPITHGEAHLDWCHDHQYFFA